jgi:DNA-binding Lrp family transcriptional regulator
MPQQQQQFFVFAQCARGATYRVGCRVIKEVPYVKDVSSISGKWDLLIKIVIDSREDVGELINDKLAAIEEIERTKTVVAYHVYDREDAFF